MPSDFLVNFHHEYFPDGDISLYSKEIFYKLLAELQKETHE